MGQSDGASTGEGGAENPSHVIEIAAKVVDLASARERRESRRAAAAEAARTRVLGSLNIKDDDWSKALLFSEGRLAATITNLAIVLQCHPAWSYEGHPVFAWNSRTASPVWVAPPPFPMFLRGHDGRSYATADLTGDSVVSDDDISRVRGWFEHEYKMRCSKEMVMEALRVSSQNYAVDPLQEYLLGLQHDGMPRLDTWLMDLLGAEPAEQPQAQNGDADVEQAENYLRAVGRMWVMSAVARALDPGCAAHHALVLEGPQGIGKSTALERLFGVWYGAPDLDFEKPQNLYPAIQGPLCIEIPEFHSVIRAYERGGHGGVKAFLSKPYDEWTPKNSNTKTRMPRRCVFCGTYNPVGDGRYLSDASGERRWWPVYLRRKIDLGRIEEMRDQIWAEAVAEWSGWEDCKKEGDLLGEQETHCQDAKRRCARHRWWPSTENQWMLEQSQAARMMTDVWDEVIIKYLLKLPDRRLLQGFSQERVLVKALQADLTGPQINSTKARMNRILRDTFHAHPGKLGPRGAQQPVWRFDELQLRALRQRYQIDPSPDAFGDADVP